MGEKRKGGEVRTKSARNAYRGISNLVKSLDFIALVEESSPLLRPEYGYT